MVRGFFRDSDQHLLLDSIVTLIGKQAITQGNPILPPKAEHQIPVGDETNPVATLAKMPGDGGDNPKPDGTGSGQIPMLQFRPIVNLNRRADRSQPGTNAR